MKARSKTPRTSAKRACDAQRSRRIAMEFAAFLHAKNIRSNSFYDEKSLPYPKVMIARACLFVFSGSNLASNWRAARLGLTALTCFQAGVGREPLNSDPLDIGSPVNAVKFSAYSKLQIDEQREYDDLLSLIGRRLGRSVES